MFHYKNNNAFVCGRFPRACQDVIWYIYRVTFLKAEKAWFQNPIWPKGFQMGIMDPGVLLCHTFCLEMERSLKLYAVSSAGMWAPCSVFSASSRSGGGNKNGAPSERDSVWQNTKVVLERLFSQELVPGELLWRFKGGAGWGPGHRRHGWSNPRG